MLTGAGASAVSSRLRVAGPWGHRLVWSAAVTLGPVIGRRIYSVVVAKVQGCPQRGWWQRALGHSEAVGEEAGGLVVSSGDESGSIQSTPSYTTRTQ